MLNVENDISKCIGTAGDDIIEINVTPSDFPALESNAVRMLMCLAY